MRQHHFYKNLIICILAILSLLLIIAAVKSVYARNSQLRNIVWIEYIIQPGDSLWQIARENCSPVIDVRHWIHEIRKRNQIRDAGALQVGQMIRIPVVGR